MMNQSCFLVGMVSLNYYSRFSKDIVEKKKSARVIIFLNTNFLGVRIFYKSIKIFKYHTNILYVLILLIAISPMFNLH